MKMKKDFYTHTEAAKRIGCSRQGLYKMLERYDLKPISFGGLKFYQSSDVERVRKEFNK